MGKVINSADRREGDMREAHRTELDSKGVATVFTAAAAFVEAFTWSQVHPDNHMGRARALAALGALEGAVDEHVSRETAELEAKLDGTSEEPPF